MPRARCHWLTLLAAGLLALASIAAYGQEVLLLGGFYTNPPIQTEDDRSYAYAYVYQQNLTEHWYASYTYLNEGHITGHHRDGHSAQLWWRYLALDRRLALSLGAGPYLYFDTTSHQPDGSYENKHGVGVLASAAASWYVGGPWMLQVRFNRTWQASGFNSNTVLLGVGYQLDRDNLPGPVVGSAHRGKDATPNELTVMLGSIVVNDFESDMVFGGALEYRHQLWRYVEGTVSYLDEGSARSVRRRGVATQAWVSGAFLGDRLTLGFGAGPYYATSLRVSGPGADPSPSHWSGLFTLSTSYRLGDHWLARLSWNRTLTGYSRDTDMFLAGLGYRF